jgi:mRNA-degrading endonuclease YafQ of YafQ-DinJ toxin-antitoxin module
MRERAFEGFNNLPPKIKKMADEIIQRLPTEYNTKTALKGPYKGLRSARVTRRFRIIFCHCEDCRANGWISYNLKRCDDCDNWLPNTLHLIDIGPREGRYDQDI